MREPGVAFEVHVNGHKVCTASVGQSGILVCMLTHAAWNRTDNPEPLDDKGNVLFQVTGTSNGTHYDWVKRFTMLDVGDEVFIQIIESAAIDEPVETRQSNPEQARRKRFEEYKKYKREFEGLDSSFDPEYS